MTTLDLTPVMGEHEDWGTPRENEEEEKEEAKEARREGKKEGTEEDWGEVEGAVGLRGGREEKEEREERMEALRTGPGTSRCW